MRYFHYLVETLENGELAVRDNFYSTQDNPRKSLSLFSNGFGWEYRILDRETQEIKIINN